MRTRFLFHGAILGLLMVILASGVSGLPSLIALDGVPARMEPAPDPASPSQSPQPAPATATPLPSPTATVTARSLPPTPSIPLQEELERYVQDLDGTYGVAVRNLADGQSVAINANREFPSASLYKVLVMYRVFQLMDRGEFSPEDEIVFQQGDLLESENGDGVAPGAVITVAEALEWMITFSSNPASYALARKVGGWDEVVAAASKLGMSGTTWDGGTFVTTPADMLRFFDLLGRRALVSPASSDDMMAILLRQQTNDRLPADLPPGTRVAHKTGELPEIRHDAGIVLAPQGAYAIVIMTEGIDPPKAARAQAEICRLAYDRFDT